MPDQPHAPQYDPDMMVRWVSPNGMVSFKGSILSAGALLADQPLGFRQIDADEWEMHYGPVLLGHWLIRKGVGRIEPLR